MNKSELEKAIQEKREMAIAAGWYPFQPIQGADWRTEEEKLTWEAQNVQALTDERNKGFIEGVTHACVYFKTLSFFARIRVAFLGRIFA